MISNAFYRLLSFTRVHFQRDNQEDQFCPLLRKVLVDLVLDLLEVQLCKIIIISVIPQARRMLLTLMALMEVVKLLLRVLVDRHTTVHQVTLLLLLVSC